MTFGVILLLAFGMNALFNEPEFAKRDWMPGSCALLAGSGPLARELQQRDCDEPHSMEMIRKISIPGGYRCVGRDCYYYDAAGQTKDQVGERASRLCQAAAADYVGGEHGTALLRYGLPGISFRSDAPGLAHAHFGRPFEAWCSAEVTMDGDRINQPLRDLAADVYRLSKTLPAQ